MAAPPPSPSPYRKPNKRLGGKEVRICGRIIQEPINNQDISVICTLPPPCNSHPIHAAIASNRDGTAVYAFLKMEDGDVQVWQLAAPPE
jgi:hypothetical protein